MSKAASWRQGKPLSDHATDSLGRRLNKVHVGDTHTNPVKGLSPSAHPLFGSRLNQAAFGR
jgi:hypothetical protein